MSRVANAQTDPSIVGQWSPLQTLPTEAVHTHVLPTGKVLFWSNYTDSLTPQLWDPSSGTSTPASAVPYEIFCAGHSFLPNGQLLVTGGNIDVYAESGYAYASIYDPFTDSWSQLPNMNSGRWYPTNTTLANGDVLVLSGEDGSSGVNTLPQVWQSATGTWRDLTTAQLGLDLYPRMFLAPNGKVFYAAGGQTTRYLDTSGTGTWTAVANSNFGGGRDYGSAVMYDNGKVLIVGGGTPPTATAEIIDLNAANPTWRYTSSMIYPRRQNNATLLPDGRVLVTGGSCSGSAFDDSTCPVYPAELWDPTTGHWTTMASITTYRGYHSTAALLPDGRVLSAGGDGGGATGEIFTPPYLFNATRPTITSAPASVGYGQTFFVGTPDATNISQVTWLRLPSVTHAFDENQRINRLSFTQTSGGLNVTAPSDSNLCPPGHYMLFILDANGVPSVAKIIQVQAAGTAAVSTIMLNPTRVVGGNSSQGTVTLDKPAPGGGAVITLSSSNTAVATVPTNVTVPAGANSVNFPVATSSVTDCITVNISGTLGATRTAKLIVGSCPIAQTGWSLEYVDSQETQCGPYGAVLSFDGNPGSFWHTQYCPTTATLPHEIQINLGASYSLSGFQYLPRQDGCSHGWISQYEFYVSTDGVNWGTAVASGSFNYGNATIACPGASVPSAIQVSFPTVSGQYVRLRALSEISGGPWTAMAELSLLTPGTAPVLSSVTPNAGSQGQTLTVNLGGAGFQGGTTCNFGAGVMVNSCTINTPTQVTASITISSIAAVGIRTVTVTNPGGLSSSLPGGFGVNLAAAGTTPPTVVTTLGYLNTSTLTTHTTAPFNSTGGDLLMVFASSHLATSTFTISDSYNNNWINISGPTSDSNGSDLRSQYWYATNAVVGSGHTISIGLSSANSLVISVFVIRGSHLGTPIDAASLIGDQGASQSTTIASPTITTIISNDLLVCFEKSFVAETSASGSGFTKDSQSSNYLSAEYGTAASPGSYNGTWSLSTNTNWQSAVLAVRP